MPFSDNRANIYNAGLESIYAKAAGDVAYYNLMNFYDGKLNINMIGQDDKHKKPNNFSQDLIATAKLLNTSKLQMMSVLQALSNDDLDFIINTQSGKAFSSALMTDNPYFGFGWKFVCDSDMDKPRYLDILIDRRLISDEYALIRGAAPAHGSADPGDDLYALNGASDEAIAAGLSKIEFRLATVSSYVGTPDESTDTITIATNPFSNTNQVVLRSTGTMPAGLTAGQVYFVVGLSGDVMGLSLTSGGSPIDFTTAGTGTLYISLVYTNVLGGFRKSSVELSLKTAKHQRGRSVGSRNVDVKIMAEGLQASGTELALISGASNTPINAKFDVKATFAGDGMSISLDDMVNVQMHYANEEEADGEEIIKFEARGVITTTQLATIFG